MLATARALGGCYRCMPRYYTACDGPRPPGTRLLYGLGGRLAPNASNGPPAGPAQQPRQTRPLHQPHPARLALSTYAARFPSPATPVSSTSPCHRLYRATCERAQPLTSSTSGRTLRWPWGLESRVPPATRIPLPPEQPDGPTAPHHTVLHVERHSVGHHNAS